MRHLQVSETGLRRAIVVVGAASDRELHFVEELFGLHPACSLFPSLDPLERLTELADYARSLKIAETGDLGKAWERTLRIELGNSLLRSVERVFSNSPGKTVVFKSKCLDSVEEHFVFFPTTPLVLVVGGGSRKGEAMKELAAAMKSRGHPVVLLQFEELHSHPARKMAELLGAVGLSAGELDWNRFERLFSA